LRRERAALEGVVALCVVDTPRIFPRADACNRQAVPATWDPAPLSPARRFRTGPAGYPPGMSQSVASRVAAGRPTLIYFSSVRSGPSRRTEAFLDQVLQARRNHRTFVRRVVDVDRCPDLAEKFAVQELPTIVVVDGGRVATRLEGRKGVAELREALGPWLR